MAAMAPPLVVEAATLRPLLVLVMLMVVEAMSVVEKGMVVGMAMPLVMMALAAEMAMSLVMMLALAADMVLTGLLASLDDLLPRVVDRVLVGSLASAADLVGGKPPLVHFASSPSMDGDASFSTPSPRRLPLLLDLCNVLPA